MEIELLLKTIELIFTEPVNFSTFNENIKLGCPILFLEYLIDNGIDHCQEDNVALYTALVNGRVDIALFLLKNGANIFNVLNQSFIESVTNGHLLTTKLILETGSTLHGKERALLIAVKNGDLEMVKLLIDNGSNISKDIFVCSMTKYRDVPGSFANLELVQLLIDKGAIIRSTWVNPLYYAVENNDINLAKLLIKNGVFNETSQYVNLFNIVENDEQHFDILKLLVEYGSQFNDDVLVNPSKNGCIRLVKLYLENGANVHGYGDGAIHFAAHKNKYDIVQLLIDNGANLTSGLTGAIISRNIDMIYFLMSKGAKIDLGCMKIAVSYENELKILLEYSIDKKIILDANSYASLLPDYSNIGPLFKNYLKTRYNTTI
jgi:ankyrin repeat protein